MFDAYKLTKTIYKTFIEGRKKEKKKKIKKLISVIKFLVLGGALKAVIGTLLKLFHAHLQVKFLLIALAGLLLNAARFWIDLKKGHSPQKVIYYEHAQHQHHYEGEDDWGHRYKHRYHAVKHHH